MSRASRRRQKAREAEAKHLEAKKQDRRWYYFGFDFVASTFIGTIYVVYTMNWWFKAALLIALATLLIHCLWIIPKKVPLKRKYKIGGTGFILLWLIIAIGLIPKDSVSEAVLMAQLQEIRALEDFLGTGKETDLRELFDFSNITKFNIRLTKREIAPQLVTREESDEMDQFFKGGRGIVSLNYSTWSTSHPGVAHFDYLPGKIGCLNISAKYVANCNRLLDFEQSSELPDNVRNAVKALDSTVNEDANILLDVLNEKCGEDPRNIIYDDSKDYTAYTSITSGAFASRVIPLEPKCDEIKKQIGIYIDSH